MPSLGEAYIEVHADTGPFDRELAMSIEKALIKAEATMRSRGRDAGNAFGQGVETAVKDHTKRIGDDLSDDLVKAAEKAGKRAASTLGTIFKDITPNLTINDKDLDRSRSRIRTWAKDVSSSVSSAFTSVGSLLSNLSGALGQFTHLSVLANPAVLVSAFGIIGGAIIGLLQVLNPLSALVLALPGAIAGLGAQALVLFAAFNNLSTAIKGAFSAKTTKEFNEATKGFVGPLREFLHGIQAFGQLWRDIVTIVQARFFAPFNDILTRVAKVLGSGKILSGIGQLAYQMGQFGAALVDMFESPAFVGLVEDLFPAIGRIVKILSGPFLTLVNGTFNLIDASLPFLESLAKLLGDLFYDFGSWLTKISKNGQLSDFFAKAVDTLKIIGGIFYDLIQLVGVFLDSLNKNNTGDNFLKTISLTLEGLTKFFSSKLGQDAIKSMVEAAMGAILVIGALIVVLTLAWQSMIYVLEGISAAFTWLWKEVIVPFGEGLQTIFKAIAAFFAEIWRLLTTGSSTAFASIRNALTSVASWVNEKWTNLRTGIATTISNVISLAQSLPGRIKAAIGDLGGLLKNAGSNLIKGLISGIENAVPGLKGTLGWVTSMIPNWKGPYDKDKTLLEPAGMALMQGLRQGLAVGAADLFTDLRALTGMISMTANANSFVFGAGSITQNFNGAQPTAVQAQALGSAVGSGIANTVNRGNMAASTRAI